jgi:CelD/BcsL family acetyltransferase involved in cellulose biosynthesis
MSIICIDPRHDPLWQTLIDQYDSDVFHSPAWMNVLTDTYGMEPAAYVQLDDSGKPQAGIPFCFVSDIRGERILSLPFSDYCDPLVKTADEWQALIAQLLTRQCSVLIRNLHNDLPLTDERFPEIKRAKWHGIDLTPDVDTMWMRLESSARRAIKKAQNAGISIVEVQDVDGLRAFFELHLGIRKRKYHLLAQPYNFFENIWHRFMEQGNGTLLVAKHDDRIIAGTLFLYWKDTFYYKFNASLPDTLEYRPSDLLIWQGMQLAKERGFIKWDFGLSDWDQDGLVRYKRKFATEEKTIYFLKHEPQTSFNPQTAGVGKILPNLTDLFTNESVPDQITEEAGNLLYRYFA